MTTTDTPCAAALLSDREVRQLNRARAILGQLEDRLTERGYTHATDATGGAKRFYSGRAAERCEAAEYAVFQVLNCLSSYSLLDLTDAQLHNRGAA